MPFQRRLGIGSSRTLHDSRRGRRASHCEARELFRIQKEASVIVSPSSLITCEQADVEVSMDIDVREQFEE